MPIRNILQQISHIITYYIKYSKGNYKPPEEYSGSAAAEVFYKTIKEEALYIAIKLL
jgi:hypothetical protein